MIEYLNLKKPNELIQVGTVGIKDIILPGDMKELLNKVVEAQKKPKLIIIITEKELLLHGLCITRPEC